MKIIMLATKDEPGVKGGIHAVVTQYRAAGLFDAVDVKYIPTHSRKGKFFKGIVFAKAVLTHLIYCMTGQASIVHAHVASRASFYRKSLLLLMAKKFGLRTIFHLHGAEFMQFYGEESGARMKAYIKYVLDSMDVILVLSEEWKADIKTITDNKNIVVLGNPVSMPDPAQVKLSHTGVHIAFLGHVGKRKGVYDLVEAMKQVVASNRDVVLDIFGEGETQKLRQVVQEAGLQENVIVHGWIDGADKKRALLTTDIYILPSYHEGLPMSILEAMSYSLPVISTNVGGIPQLVETGVEGVLVNAGDIEALASAILTLAKDERARLQMGQNAFRKVEAKYKVENVISKLQDVYGQLLQAR